MEHRERLGSVAIRHAVEGHAEGRSRVAALVTSAPLEAVLRQDVLRDHVTDPPILAVDQQGATAADDEVGLVLFWHVPIVVRQVVFESVDLLL